MNAPMGSFSGYGQRTRAATVVDRSVKELDPGTYAARVRLPVAGRYEVALLLENPRLLHCFSVEVAENPALHEGERPLRVDFVNPPASAPAGSRVALRFTIQDSRTGKPQVGVPDASVLSFRAPGFDREDSPARPVGAGVYEAQVPLPSAGAYYLYVGAPSLGLKHDDLPFRTLQAIAPRTAAGPAKEKDHATQAR